jgi:outer membrane lipoprotein SlyB
MSDEKPTTQQSMPEQPVPEQPSSPTSEPIPSHSVAAKVGAAGGGAAGVALGKSVAGRVGAVVGGVVGAIAGTKAVEALSDFAVEASESLGLGADAREVELPKHYSWEELQALSKPQEVKANA